MCNANKPLFISFFIVFLIVLPLLTSSVIADPNPLVLNQHPEGMSLHSFMSENEGGEQIQMTLSFDPNAYNFLVYDCGTGEIQVAMDKLGLSYVVRNRNNAVTAQDLIDYDILIVGWKTDTDGTDGLDPAIIEQGIIGRVILTGHDTDWHTAANREEQPHAERFLSQCIGYILDGGSTGLLAHGQPVSGFDWLPESWGVEVVDGLALETITGFTSEGIDSGIFDGLTKE